MIVRIEDLRIGDEILVPCLVDFKRLRIAKLPAKNEKGFWKHVVCDITNNNLGEKWARYDCSSAEYNDKIRMDLAYRRLWLINRVNI